MAGWDLFKNAYSSFLCSAPDSMMITSSGSLCLRSGINHPSFNFFIVDNITSNMQKQMFINNFNCDGFVASFVESHDVIESWSPTIKYLGQGILMTARPENVIIPETDPSIVVKRATDEETIKHHIMIMEEVRQVSGYKKIVAHVIDSMRIYVAYINGKPAGTGSAIDVNGSAFILDTITRDMFRNSGVLASIGAVSMREAKEQGVQGFSAIVTSGYSESVAKQIGFRVEQVFDFWKNKVN